MLEAMATGLPVVASTHGGIPEAVTHERTGLLVEERDDEALFHALEQITGADAFRSSLGEAASRAVREEFEQAKAIQRLEDFYEEAQRIHSAPSR
jgi:colanic acid/amylovoran biosynthesis glycosyltransferase